MASTNRAAIYTRVSSTGQEDNYSLLTQEAACRAFAAERGWEVAGVYTDVHTRVELWERPQLSALREAVRRREVDTLICNAIDRLSGDPVHLGVILSEADHAGVDVVFVTEPLDDSPEGQLIRFVRGYAAKVEHEKIKERTMRGKIARVQSGKPAVGPRPPYGYRWRDDRDENGKPVKLRLEENPETAWVVRRIFAEVAAGSSARQVGIRLAAERIASPTGMDAWPRATIVKLLHNRIYVGEATALRYRRQKIKLPSRDPGQFSHVPVERLEPVTMVDLHVAAQAAVTPSRVLDDAAVCRQEWRIGIRCQVDAVVEVTADRRISGLEPEGAAAEGPRKHPRLQWVVERAGGYLSGIV